MYSSKNLDKGLSFTFPLRPDVLVIEASITSTSGLNGNVKLKPLSRFFDEYIIEGNLFIGDSLDKLQNCYVEHIKGLGKSRSFKLKNHDSASDAKSLIGKRKKLLLCTLTKGRQ